MNSKFTAVVLAVLVAATEAGSFEKLATNFVGPTVTNDGTWEGLGLVADVNHYVDQTIGMLVPFIKQHGLDPMRLPNVREGFEVRPLLITYSAWLEIHDGYATGFVNVQRSGDQTVNYFAKMMRIRIQLQFTDLEFVYRYLVKVMNIGPTGGIVGSLNRFVVVFDLLIDFNNDELHLQEFAIRDIGSLRVRLNGNILIDWLVNPVIRVFTAIFDNVIIGVVRNNIQGAIQGALDFVNTNVKDIVQNLESYGRV